jgi:hypothetical protein
MRRPTTQGILVLHRVNDFLADNAATGPIGSVDKQVKELSACLDLLDMHAGVQDAATHDFRSAAARAREARATLRNDYLRPIARLARVIFPRGAPERTKFLMPRARSYHALIAAAEGLAERAAAHKTALVEGGLSEDFVERLMAAVSALRTALDDKARHFGRRAAATTGTESEYARGRRIVAYLDTVVTPTWKSTPARLAEWKALSRFARQAGSVDPAREEPTPTPAGGGSRDGGMAA